MTETIKPKPWTDELKHHEFTKLLKESKSVEGKILRALCRSKYTKDRAADIYSQLLHFEADNPAEACEICVQCQQPFVTANNDPGRCRYHVGDPTADLDHRLWQEYPRDMIDSVENDPDVVEASPEAFDWNCCNRPMAEKGNGCRRGKHVSHPDEAWRTGDAYVEASSDEEDYEDFDDVQQGQEVIEQPPAKKQKQ